MLSGTEAKNPKPASSVTSLLSASSNSSGASANSASGQSSSMALATAVHKMDAELRCPACRRYFHCPLLLPCGHSLCTSCAASALLPSTEATVAATIHNTLTLINSNEGYRVLVPGTGYSSSSSASSTAGSSIAGSSLAGTVQTNLPIGMTAGVVGQIPPASSSHSDSDQLSVVSETDSGVVVSSRPGSYIGRLPVILCQSAITPAIATAPGSLPSTTGSTTGVSGTINLNIITHGLICPSCNRTVGLLDENGLSQLPRNRALERVIDKFVSPELLQEKPPIEIGTFPLLPPSDPLSRPGGPLCQLCEDPDDTTNIESGNNAIKTTNNLATTWCEQCEIFYCTSCRERCHPSRGPLMRHCLHTAAKGVELIKQKRQNQPAPCPVHPHMLVNLFCIQCQTQVCNECLITEGSTTQENHGKHEIQPLNSICKARKTELSQALQSLSERARTGTECIQRLRMKSEAYNHKLLESERQISEQLDMLIRTLEKKKAELIDRLRTTRDEKVQYMKEQITQVTSMLTKSTGLIQFCIEMLKEGDPTAFLVVSQSLIARTHETEHLFIQELEQASVVNDHAESLLSYSVSSTSTNNSEQRRSSPRKTSKAKSEQKCLQRPNDFTLEQNTMEVIRRAILDLSLSEEQGKKPTEEDRQSTVDVPPSEVPAAPRFIVEACISERNVITLVWQPTSATVITKYTLELDDGANGNFRKVYRGPETICTVEGLHFRSVYRARVKAHNAAGESLYSERLCLQTSDLTWFHMDPSTACPDILLTNGNRTMTSQINEDRVILGSTGLSRGVHYWEFTVDRCDLGGQPAFGIARVDCNKEIMLGLDMKSWSVYFDYKRSWFLHNGEHFERTDGGVCPGSVVGVRLDFHRGSLSYYLNDEPHGPIAFTNLPAGIYYPAVSITRAVQLTLHSGLEAPSESEESDEDSSGGGTGTETTSMATTVLAMPSNKPSAHQLLPSVSKP